MTLRTFRSLLHYNYRLWAAGALVSNIGTWVQRTAQDWFVFAELTRHNGSAVGIVMALQFAPQFLLLPWSGHAADSLNQRKLLMATQATMGALAVALGILTVTGLAQLWHVYVFAFLFGSAAALDAPVRQTFVAELVGDDDLPNAVALNSMSFNLARMIGPAVSGVAIATVGTGWGFLANGASFLAVLISLMLLRQSELRPNRRAPRGKGHFVEGLRYVRGRPDLVAILLMLFFIGTFGLNFPIFVSTMGVRIFHVDAAGYGLLSSIMAIGTITGAFLNAGRDRIEFRNLIVSATVFGFGCTLAALAPCYWFFAAALVVIGVAALSFTNATNSLMQLSTAATMRGRVMALRVGIALGGTPIGAPIVGWVADHESPRWAMAIAALSGIIAAVIGVYANKKQVGIRS
ncbi:MFS transporter [Rhizobium sp.]|uniref:MFS transporter n=1 Tax=Rhizobium sp. TaxID=391 RepID=UPI0034C5CB78